MVLTIQEVAVRLNMPAETVQRWIRQGKIPMQQNQGEYTIRREMLTRWAEEHNLKVVKVGAPEFADGVAAKESVLDGIFPAMQRGGILYDLCAVSKEPLLRMAVDRIPNLSTEDQALIYEKLLEREHLASTGIGHGIALPHPRSNPGIGLKLPQITTCFLTQPVPFDAIDHRPVAVMMILLSGSTKQHLSLLSKLSFHLRDRTFREYLLSAPPAEALLDKMNKMEAETG